MLTPGCGESSDGKLIGPGINIKVSGNRTTEDTNSCLTWDGEISISEPRLLQPKIPITNKKVMENNKRYFIPGKTLSSITFWIKTLETNSESFLSPKKRDKRCDCKQTSKGSQHHGIRNKRRARIEL